MITLIEALNYRSLKYISQPLGPFHVLIGPNASGKSTFLDVVAFLGQLVSDGVETAVRERTENFVDLLWKREGTRFELAIEAALPADVLAKLGKSRYDTVRYELAVGVVPGSPTEELGILHERMFLKRADVVVTEARSVFPDVVASPKTLLHKVNNRWQTVVSKSTNGIDKFESEVLSKVNGGSYIFRLGRHKSALGSLPPDETQFPAATWLKRLLTDGVQPFVLNSIAIRQPSPPNQRRGLRTDGSNLPWVVFDLLKYGNSPPRFEAFIENHFGENSTYINWINHLRTALPDLVGVRSEFRPEDRHRYLVLEYENGIRVPSWVASDGTLRMLALTLPAYLPPFHGIYLIEEPENGIHPKAIETVYQSLSSVYHSQILMASHSPVILGCASKDVILCFAKNKDGATDIVTGTNHPRLNEWHRETNLGQLFAAGVLG